MNQWLLAVLGVWLIGAAAYAQPADDPLPAGAVARLGTTRFRHGGPIDAVAYHPDGKIIAAASAIDLILWDAETGKALHRLEGPGYAGGSLDFSPDGKSLASTTHGTLRLWDVAGGKMIEEHRLVKRPGTVRYAPDGKHLALCGDDEALLIWNVADKKVVKRLPGHSGRVHGVAWSPDGTRLASVADDPGIRQWDWAQGNDLPRLGDNTKFVHLLFGPKGTTVAARPSAGAATLFDVESGKVLDDKDADFRQKYTHATSVLSRDGQRWAYTYANKITVQDPVTQKLLSPDDDQSLPARAVAFSPDSKTLATEEASQLKIWSVPKMRLLHTIKGDFGGEVGIQNGLAFHGETLLALGRHHNLQSHDARSGTWSRTHSLPVSTSHPWSTRFCPDGKHAVACYYGGNPNIWLFEVATGKIVRELKGTGSARVFDVSPDSKTLAEVYSKGPTDKYFVWRSLETGKELKKVQLDPKEAALVEWTCLAWSADGKWLAAGSTLGALHLYDAVTGKEHAKIPGIRGQVIGVAWSPDGHWLASSSTDTTVLIWNARRWTKAGKSE